MPLSFARFEREAKAERIRDMIAACDRASPIVETHASVHSLFNTERSLYSRPNFKQTHAAALAEWSGLRAA